MPCNVGMNNDPEKMDASETVARIVRETTGDLDQPLSDAFEAACFTRKQLQT